MQRLNRKAISPLIATVLLLAFAVALGTIAVSYLLDFASPNPCSHVSVRVEQACYTDGTVTFIAENTGDTPIASLQARFVNANNDLKENQLALSLTAGSASSISVPYTALNPTSVTLTVTPKILVDTSEKFCTDKETSVKLGTC